MSKKPSPPVALQKKYAALFGEDAPTRYKNDKAWLGKKIEEKEAWIASQKAPETGTPPVDDGVKTPGDDTPPETTEDDTPPADDAPKTNPKDATRAVVTIDGLYKRTYTKEAHGDAFIDNAAEYCSRRDGAEFTLEKE